jgi:hypothetical protein
MNDGSVSSITSHGVRILVTEKNHKTTIVVLNNSKNIEKHQILLRFLLTKCFPKKYNCENMNK